MRNLALGILSVLVLSDARNAYAMDNVLPRRACEKDITQYVQEKCHSEIKHFLLDLQALVFTNGITIENFNKAVKLSEPLREDVVKALLKNRSKLEKRLRRNLIDCEVHICGPDIASQLYTPKFLIEHVREIFVDPKYSIQLTKLAEIYDAETLRLAVFQVGQERKATR